MKNILLLFVFVIFSLTLNAQTWKVRTDISAVETFKYQGSGLALNIEICYLKNKNHEFGMFLQQIYRESGENVPKDIKSNRFFMRDFTNVAPLGEDNNLWKWDLNSFPKMRLKSKPNRYFNFNIGFSYNYIMHKKSDWLIGSDLFLSFSDRMKISKVIETKEIEFLFPFGFILQDERIPVTSYATYFDFGIAPHLQYNIFRYKRLIFGIKSKLYIYPLSPDYYSTLGCVITWSGK